MTSKCCLPIPLRSICFIVLGPAGLRNQGAPEFWGKQGFVGEAPGVNLHQLAARDR